MVSAIVCMFFGLLGNPKQLQSFSRLVLGFLLDGLWLLGKEVLLSQMGKFNLNYVGICIYSFICIISNSTWIDNMISYDIFRHSYCCFILSPPVLSLSPPAIMRVPPFFPLAPPKSCVSLYCSSPPLAPFLINSSLEMNSARKTLD